LGLSVWKGSPRPYGRPRRSLTCSKSAAVSLVAAHVRPGNPPHRQPQLHTARLRRRGGGGFAGRTEGLAFLSSIRFSSVYQLQFTPQIEKPAVLHAAGSTAAAQGPPGPPLGIHRPPNNRCPQGGGPRALLAPPGVPLPHLCRRHGLQGGGGRQGAAAAGWQRRACLPHPAAAHLLMLAVALDRSCTTSGALVPGSPVFPARAAAGLHCAGCRRLRSPQVGGRRGQGPVPLPLLQVQVHTRGQLAGRGAGAGASWLPSVSAPGRRAT
jgi:hypothetical protein